MTEWGGREFSVIDTGGYVINSDDIFEEEIRKQVVLAIEESDVILFMVDVTNGITDLDDSVTKILRKSGKKIILVVNKVDNNSQQYDTQIFYKLGLGEVFPVSSISGSGTGELMDEIIKNLPSSSDFKGNLELPKIAIVGRPNVGKSSLLNALIDEERHIVTPIAGTTRDSIYTRYNKFGHDFYLIDTAGLRKKGKVSEDLEFYSVMRAIRTIEESDVCLLLIDATRGLEAQDLNIFQLIQKNRKGLVILVNKWDLVDKETNTSRDIENSILERLQPFNDIPVVFTSASYKAKIAKGT